jgi:imidazolonepropionase
MRQLGIIEDGAIVVRDERIAWVGPTDALPENPDEAFDASNCVVLPGFVDSHTHPVFAGYRVDEFEWRLAGLPYMEILERGGGIQSSVDAVRSAAQVMLQEENRFLEHGTTTIEAKSGYGLTLEHEIRLLEAMRHTRALDLAPTYLGAHAVPSEYRNDRRAYISGVLADIGEIARGKLAEFCDVFVEPGAFTCDEAREIFRRARDAGLGIRVHADEFQRSGGAALAVEMDAASADHLGAINDDDVQLLSRSSVVATLLPATLFMLGEHRYAPARKLIESGAAVALASDFNPGTSPTMNMQFVMSLACTQMRISPAEALVAATINGAAAIRRENVVGTLEAGKQADFSVYSTTDYREIPYRAGMNSCLATFKRGKLVYESNRRMRS